MFRICFFVRWICRVYACVLHVSYMHIVCILDVAYACFYEFDVSYMCVYIGCTVYVYWMCLNDAMMS